MGYLQVRDFPEELHEELRLLAKREHRSVSQQTIIAIKEHIAQAANRAMANQVFSPSKPWQSDSEIDYGAKRRRIFERLDALDIPDVASSPEEIVQMVHEGREELNARIGY